MTQETVDAMKRARAAARRARTSIKSLLDNYNFNGHTQDKAIFAIYNLELFIEFATVDIADYEYKQNVK